MPKYHSTVGNLVVDPVVKDTERGKVTAFAIAHQPERYNAETRRHEKTGPVEYYEVSAWGKLGENVASSLKKGDRATVAGVLTESTFERQDGSQGLNRSISAREVGASLAFVEVSIGSRSVADTPPF